MQEKKPIKLGRPTKLTDQIQEHILKAIRIGVPRDDAFRVAGIDPNTGYEWLKRGRAGEEVYRDFARAVEKADSEFTALALGRIATAAPKQWQAAAWMLERKKPAQFAQRVRVTVDEELNAFLDKLERKLPRELFDKILDAAADGAGGSTQGDEAPGAGLEPEAGGTETPDAG